MKEIIKNLKGNVLILGVNEEEYLTYIKENKNIEVCYSIEPLKKKGKSVSLKKEKKSKKINIKKLKKYFVKNKIDGILCKETFIFTIMKMLKK